MLKDNLCPASALVEVRDLSLFFVQHNQAPLEIFSHVNFNMSVGDQIALVGRSGSGKSSLLYLLAGMLEIEQGTICLAGQNIKQLSGDQLAALRNKKIGFVFQFHHLLPDLTVLDNVMLPCLIAKRSASVAREQANKILHRVGLGERLNYYPSNLSGGERQRVAIARALVNSPDLLLADEPTGNLDLHTSQEIVSLLVELAKEQQMTTLIVTHDLEIAQSFNRQFLLYQQQLHTNLDLQQIKQLLLAN